MTQPWRFCSGNLNVALQSGPPMGDSRPFGVRRSSGLQAVDAVRVAKRRCALVVDGMARGRWSAMVGDIAYEFARSGDDEWPTDGEFVEAVDRLARALGQDRNAACRIADDKSTA